MKNMEMNRLTAWLAGVFPQWKPDKAVASVWAKELPNVLANQVIEAVRKLQEVNPSPFPPGLFEIISVVTNKKLTSKADGLILFQELWNTRTSEDPLALKAYNLIGQDYGQCQSSDRSWHEKRFVEIYNGLAEKEVYNDVEMLTDGKNGQDPLTLGAKHGI